MLSITEIITGSQLSCSGHVYRGPKIAMYDIMKDYECKESRKDIVKSSEESHVEL